MRKERMVAVVMSEKELQASIEQSVRHILAEYYQKKIMTLDECAEYLGLSKNTLDVYRSQRKIPFYKPNGKAYYSREEVDAWILYSDNRVKTTREIVEEAELTNKK